MRRCGLYGVSLLLLLGAGATRAQTPARFDESLVFDEPSIPASGSGIRFQSGYGESDWIVCGGVAALTTPDDGGNQGVSIFDMADVSCAEFRHSPCDEILPGIGDRAGVVPGSPCGAGDLRFSHVHWDGPGALGVNAWAGQHVLAVCGRDMGHCRPVDDIRADAGSLAVRPVPAPGAVLLGAVATSLVGRLRRRQVPWLESVVP